MGDYIDLLESDSRSAPQPRAEFIDYWLLGANLQKGILDITSH